MSKLETTENPYLSARREWNERYGSYIASANSWKIIAMLSMLVAVISVIGVVYIGSQNKMIPYVVEVDKLGKTVAVAPATQAGKNDSRVVKAYLADFIVNFRSVIVDAAVQRQVINKTYSLLSNSSPATQSINQYFQDGNSPLQRAATETVTVEINSVLPISDKTWQVEWKETERSRRGLVKAQKRFKAAITVKFMPPTKEIEILRNPIGLYVEEISWSEQY